MVKSLGVGFGIVVVGIATSLFSGNWPMGMNVSGTIGTVLLMLAAIFSGAAVSGDRVRAAYGNSSDEERDRRRNWSSSLFLIGFPPVALTIVYYWLSSK